MPYLSRFSLLFCVVLAAAAPRSADAAQVPVVRVATYNTSMFRDEDGQLARDLESGDNQQAKSIAEVIQRERPDIILLNEFDYDAEGHAAKLFMEKYLA